MAETEAPLPELVAPRRPWYRLHLSTWVVLFVALIVLVLLIVPGELIDGDTRSYLPYAPLPEAPSPGSFQHGWPWTYLERAADGADFSARIWGGDAWVSYPPWCYVCAWSFAGDDGTVFWPGVLVLDIVAAALILFLTAATVEWRRRRLRHIWQFTLRELLLVMLLLAVMLAWWRTNHVRLGREKDVLHFSSAFESGCSEYRGPVYLEKLVGTGFLENFFKVTSFSLSNNRARDVSKLESPLSDSLPDIELLVAEEGEQSDFEEIAKLRHLKSLVLFNTIVTDAESDIVSRMSSLERLCLRDSPISSKGILALRSLARLRELYLCGVEIGDQSARALAYLDSLQYLCIRESLIKRHSVAYLANLTKLKELHTVIMDIPREERERLEMLLPRCKIVYESDGPPEIVFPSVNAHGTGMF